MIVLVWSTLARCIPKVLVVVELWLCGDFFFAFSKLYCFRNKIYVLLCSCLICIDTVVEQISNDAQIQNALLGVYIRNISDPFLLRIYVLKFPLSKLGYRCKFSPYVRYRFLLMTDSESYFCITLRTVSVFTHTVSFEPYMYSAVAISLTTLVMTLSVLIVKR